MDLMSADQVKSLTTASSPGEAAQVFLGEVSKGLAAVIAKALGDAVTNARTVTASSAAIEGWADLIGGCAMTMCWERQLGLPVGQVVGFAPMDTGSKKAPGAMGISVGGSITITGTF